MVKPHVCSDCPALGQSGPVAPRISDGSEVLVVLPPPTASELRSGMSAGAYTERGAILRTACRRFGFDLEQLSITSLGRCAGAGPEARRTCAHAHLLPLIDRLRPRMLVALGEEPLVDLTGLRGQKLGLRDLRGWVLDTLPLYGGLPVIASYDPEWIRQGQMDLLGVLGQDLRKALELGRKGWTAADRRPGTYTVDPAEQEIEGWVRRVSASPDLPIAFDIETNYSLRINDEEELRQRTDEITQIQFSAEAGTALVMQWREPWIRWARQILALPNPKMGWNNWIFDTPILNAHGIEVMGREDDLMWMWWALEPDIPRGLQYAASFMTGHELSPWKHTAEVNLATYGGIDVDVLVRMNAPLRAALSGAGAMGAYDRYLRQLWPILRRMGERGIPVSLSQRDELEQWLGIESRRLFFEIQADVPEELKPRQWLTRKPSPRLKGWRPAPETGEPEWFDKRSDQWVSAVERQDATGQLRWCKIKPFLPNSADQVKAYMRHFNHPVPTEPDRLTGEEKEKATKRELLRLARKTGHKFYEQVVELRELNKVASTYIDGWPLARDGRVHSTFGYGPASWQMNSKTPNVQNFPKRGVLASRIRQVIEAPAGHLLVEVDVSAFHSVLTGWLAHDPSYIRISRLDPHSFLTAHVLRLDGVDDWIELPDEELAERLHRVKKQHKDFRDGKAKMVIHGNQFGLGYRKMYRMGDGAYESEAEARRIQDTLKALFPRIFRWQDEVAKEAHTRGFLQNHFGCLRRFHDVFRWNPSAGRWDSGSQRNECLAYLPSSNAHLHFRDIVLRLEEGGWLERFNLVNLIHDSILCLPREEDAELCIRVLSEEISRPSTILVDEVMGPLNVGCEASIGRNWAAMEVYENR